MLPGGHISGWEKWGGFNMTAIIDIVFLLMIFFLVVCRFIEAENFPVTVPADCAAAAELDEPGAGVTTLTVMKRGDGGANFAVGSEIISVQDNDEIIDKLRRAIDTGLKNSPVDCRLVTLRIDKDICFGDAQYALAAVARSNATDIQLAVLKNNRSESEHQKGF